MKRFYLLPLFLVMLTSCKYGSYYEAKKSCNEWSKKVQYKIDGVERNYRFCRKEEETNQMLGFEYKNIKPINYKYSDFYEIEDRGAFKVKKRFKY